MQHTKNLRTDGRPTDQIRRVRITHDVFEYAAGSVLFEMGKTKVLCAVTIQNGVPLFLRGKNTGWLTAEYALMPASTTTRSQRDKIHMRPNGRSVEIARLIGRSLRSIVDLSQLGERTITIDCDVLQADGGTRTAAITGAHLALRMAQRRWLQSKTILQPLLRETIAAISVGVVNNKPLLDLDYAEDSNASADFNFVITQSNKIIEMQGCAEQEPLSWGLFDQMRVLASSGVNQLFDYIDQDILPRSARKQSTPRPKKHAETPPLFSLKNRQVTSS